MTNREFYKIYLPALENALENDNKNLGFFVEGPDFYISEEFQNKVEDYICHVNDSFIDLVEEYFDAKSHYFPTLGDKSIELVKQDIKARILNLKKEYKL